MTRFLLVLGFALALVLPGASHAQLATAAMHQADHIPTVFRVDPTSPFQQMLRSSRSAITSNVLHDGTVVTMTSAEVDLARNEFARLLQLPQTRVAENAVLDAAGVFAGVARVGSVIGIASLLIDGVPALAEWIAGDNAQHIRVAADGKSLEKKSSSGCSVDCFWYHMNGWSPTYDQILFPDAASVCAGMGGAPVGNPPYACTSIYGNIWFLKIPRSPDPSNWLPASMDDIAPYMTPRMPPQAVIPQVLSKDGYFVPSLPPDLHMLDPIPSVPPTTIKWEYPAPAEETGSGIEPGNPYNQAPDNTWREIGRSVVPRLLYPQNPIITGPTPDPIPTASPIPSPHTTIREGQFDPTDGPQGSTRTRWRTNADPYQRTIEIQPNPTVQNNTPPGTITVTNNYTTNNYIKNLVTNITNNETPPPPRPPSEKQSPLCDLFPDILACAKLGDPPGAEQLSKTNVPVVVTPVPFAGGGSCPAPVTFTAYGVHQFSYQPLCDKLIYLKVLFLAIAGVLAAYILADSFRVV